jgi:hypothetical protein
MKDLPGFTVAVTNQGLRYYKGSEQNEASFIDLGRVIRVYMQDDETLLASLQLAQEKWGGVRIHGTDEYKRRCAEIAAKNGIRVANPELSGIVKEFERTSKPPMSVEAACKAIETETRVQEGKHWKAWDSYKAHKKALETLTANEPTKPKVFGVSKWRIEHNEWEFERCRLLKSLDADLESLGVKRSANGTGIDKADKEAAARHERFKEYAAEEARRLHPDAAVIIREDDVRLEREERARIETEEAKARIEEENRRRFRASILKLAAKFGNEAPIVTNAQDGRNYSGLVMGTVESNAHCYAVQMIGDNRVILHRVEKDNLPQITSIIGRNVDIKCLDGRIGAITQEPKRHERSRGWGR